MCTVLLRFAPGEPWPLLLGAVRDEFVDRAWDAPDSHWSGEWSHLVGGRDRKAGGTWLAVDRDPPAVAALLNGRPRPAIDTGTRPTRGELALRVLTTGQPPAPLDDYDRFHLLRATPTLVELWSWDGDAVTHQRLEPGTHIVVNAGLDTHEDPLVPHFAALLASLPAPGANLDQARDAWLGLLGGDGLDPSDDRALLVRKEVEGRTYGSTSCSLVALPAAGPARYEFNPTPDRVGGWHTV